MKIGTTWKQILVRTFSDFFADRGPRLGAALAFYMVFSIAPLVVLSMAVATAFYGPDAVEGQLKHQLTGLLGENGAEAIQSMVAAAQKAQHKGMVASIVGAVALLFGAMGVFLELVNSMNTVWGVEVRSDRGLWGTIKDSTFAFLMVLIIAFLLLFSMILSTVLSTLSHTINLPASAQITDFAVSSTVTTLLFAFIFKYLPDAKVLWKDVWIGAIVTALLFAVGKYLVGLYLANTHIASAYGAASSLLAFMLWMYYSSQIFFLGAEFTQVYSQINGREVEPAANARVIHQNLERHSSVAALRG